MLSSQGSGSLELQHGKTQHAETSAHIVCSHEVEPRDTQCCGLEVEDQCWICLSSEKPFIRQCACPSRLVHQACLAQWQIVSAGRSEETSCRFCAERLPDWRLSLADKPRAAPLMTVTHNNEIHVLRVTPGEEGRETFERDIRRIFGLTPEDHVAVTFGIKDPFAGRDVTLEGWGAWGAAVECAACSAGTRQEPPVLEGDLANKGEKRQAKSFLSSLFGSWNSSKRQA